MFVGLHPWRPALVTYLAARGGVATFVSILQEIFRICLKVVVLIAHFDTLRLSDDSVFNYTNLFILLKIIFKSFSYLSELI